jgi:hypothetical protein
MKFIKKLHSLTKRGENSEIDYFFDKIKKVCNEWIDDCLYGLEYELELIDNTGTNDSSWISINLGLNRETDKFEKNEILNSKDEFDKFYKKIDINFNLYNKDNLISIDVEGDINIFDRGL